MSKTTLLVVAFVVAAVAARDFPAMFNEFKTKFNRNYKSPEEELFRYNAFVNNMREAAVYQATNPLATFGMNVYSDMTREEFKVYHNLDLYPRDVKSSKCSASRTPNSNYPKAYDWRQHGAVTSIKNQGQCGSCWAFSAVANIEGQWALAGNTLVSLSEQEVVSCDTVDQGCNGGDPSTAYNWLLQNRGGSVDTDASYPYTSGNGATGKCLKTGTVGATFQECEEIEHNEQYMAQWSASFGPVSICLDATSFQSYTSGILTNCVSQQVDHCVTIVGYDETNSPPYWIVKNSWGTSWGEQGYIYIEMFKNECLITSQPSSVVVQKK